MTTDLVRANRIPADWGLEVGVLAEVFRNCSLKRVAQVELVANYDHKHQDLSPNDATRGLHRMVVDIAASLIRNLASYGVEFEAGFLNTLIAAYVRTAQDSIARYSDDAKLRWRSRPSRVHCEPRVWTSFAIRWEPRRFRTGVVSCPRCLLFWMI
jgi:glucosyl-3-phosphoglycerate synthase